MPALPHLSFSDWCILVAIFLGFLTFIAMILREDEED